jgi:hypothetical protein
VITSVFISYATAPPDGNVAKALHGSLTKSGIKIPAWRDREKLRGGEVFGEKFAKAIAATESFLFLLSPRSIASKWCRRELTRADALEKPIVPLLLDDVPRDQLPLELEGVQHIDFRRGVRHGIPALRHALGITKIASDDIDDPVARDDRRMQAIAQAFRHGDTFANTANMVLLLQKLGLECVETARALRVLQALRYGDHRSGREVAEWLLRRWEGSPLPRPEN